MNSKTIDSRATNSEDTNSRHIDSGPTDSGPTESQADATTALYPESAANPPISATAIERRLQSQQLSLSAITASNDLDTTSPEALITDWLSQLLRHFSIDELDQSSAEKLANLLANCNGAKQVSLENNGLLLELKRRILRLAGARLDNAFVEIATEVIEEETLEAIFLTVESRQLQGVRYRGNVYRLVEAFSPCHRLQAFCHGQTLREKKLPYLVTRSPDRFAVWVNIEALPQQHDGT